MRAGGVAEESVFCNNPPFFPPLLRSGTIYNFVYPGGLALQSLRWEIDELSFLLFFFPVFSGEEEEGAAILFFGKKCWGRNLAVSFCLTM